MPARINHISVARKYLEKANKLSQLLQAKGLSKSHSDYAKLKRFRQRAEIHMMQHKDVTEGQLSPTSKNPYLAVEEKDEEKKKSKISGFREFSKKEKEDDDDDDGGNDDEETGEVNDAGEKVRKLSGKKDKVIIHPQMRTVQTNLPGGQQK